MNLRFLERLVQIVIIGKCFYGETNELMENLTKIMVL
jgi:hypothetical protein